MIICHRSLEIPDLLCKSVMTEDGGMPRYVLYTIKGKACKGCTRAVDIMETFPEVSEAQVLLQDVDSLKEEDIAIPSWLVGVPTLVEIATRKKWQGSMCLVKLQDLLQRQSLALEGRKRKDSSRGERQGQKQANVPTPLQEDKDALMGLPSQLQAPVGAPASTGTNNNAGDEGPIQEEEEEEVETNTDAAFHLEAGCDPLEADTGKVTESEVQTMMKARGLEM